ncbi:uncharacterized protein SPPG_03315 [Spizellomyces punctatus DAOM BR117]|uniref:Uncharacterized protein n=1 Tax=Spizellomyces punctatus (strain DAOM BR117) TaxID=645134 RepID=A0A0L0HK81_SPIPD|nr:uncharacterized protein SPPG_03315 [Spizellomyces punctatus DAOM BR117]KND01517.1 hypothetical protein SPPG_03315 [Spizellomyces punctatus DAOM BR117]|eukprot:XP_016609556.1 hypothetical protein SPPG_03315 [Spizellomyces punctatus DAOM BR117]
MGFCLPVTCTTDSSSATTGSLQVAGGVGISKNLYCGGSLYSNNLKVATESYVGTAIASKQASSPLLDSISGLVPAANSFIIGSSATSFTVKSPAEVRAILGVTDVDISGKQNASPLLDSISSLTPTSGMFVMSDATGFVLQSTSTVKSILNIPDYASDISTLQANVSTLQGNVSTLQLTISTKQDALTTSSPLSVATITSNDTTDSTSASTGALQVKGGAGIAKKLWVSGAQMTIQNTNYSVGQTNTLMFSHATQNICYIQSYLPGSNNVDLNFFVGSSNSSIRSMVLNGATGIAYFDRGIVVSSTTDSTSIMTGALQVAGGIGVSKNIFAGGDLTIGNNNVSGLHSLVVRNTDTGTNACSILYLTASGGSSVLFMNGSNRSVDGGQNCLTLRNDVGALRLQSQGAKGIYVYPNTGNVVVESTTPALLSTTGALVVNGGVAVGAHVVAGGNLYSNGPVYLNGQVCTTQAWVSTQVFPKIQVFKLLTKDVITTGSGTKTFYVTTAGRALIRYTINLHGTNNANGTLNIHLGTNVGSMASVFSSDFNYNAGVNRTVYASFIVSGLVPDTAYFTNFGAVNAAPDISTDITTIEITELGP